MTVIVTFVCGPWSIRNSPPLMCVLLESGKNAAVEVPLIFRGFSEEQFYPAHLGVVSDAEVDDRGRAPRTTLGVRALERICAVWPWRWPGCDPFPRRSICSPCLKRRDSELTDGPPDGAIVDCVAKCGSPILRPLLVFIKFSLAVLFGPQGCS